MAVKFSTKGYNVGTVEISTKLSEAEAKNVGVEGDMDMLKMLCNTGFCRMKFVVGGDSDVTYDLGVLLSPVNSVARSELKRKAFEPVI